MTKIKLQYLKMENVKGIKELSLNFLENKSFAVANGKGKSTVLDTIMWMLTGQTDLQNRKFDPQSKTSNDKATVSLALAVNDTTHVLQISMSPKSELTYVIDGKLMKKSEYTQTLVEWGLKDILLVANPLYLLNYLTWQEAREIITSFISEPTDTEVENYLLSKYPHNHSFNGAITIAKSAQWDKETIKLLVSNNKTKSVYLTGQLNGLGSTLAPQDINFDLLKVKKQELEAKRLELENVDLRNELVAKINELGKEEIDAHDNYKKLENEIRARQIAIEQSARAIASLSEDIVRTQQNYNQALTVDFSDECSLCHHKISDDMIAKMRDNQYTNANAIRTELDKLVNKQIELKAGYVSQKLELDNFVLQANSAITFFKNKEEAIRYEKDQTANKLANSFDTASIVKIDNELLEINKQLAFDNENVKAKMVEIQNEVNETLAKITELELVLTFIEERTQFIASDVKRKLKHNFPELEIILENQLKNGSTKPNFTVSYLGVEYKDLNTAAKIKAGIIFAKGMQQLLDLHSPILLDNFEALDTNTASEFKNDDLITMSVGLGDWNA